MASERLTKSKALFEDFVDQVFASVGRGRAFPKFQLPKDDEAAAEVIASVLSSISRFFYQRPSIRSRESGTDHKLFSAYHRFWSENCEAVLGLEVDATRCLEVAKRLEKFYKPYSLSRITDTAGIDKKLIPNVRLFVSIQDFGVGFKENYYKLAAEKPYLFDPREIVNHPEYANEVAQFLGVEDYQADKRLEWARRCARWLVKDYDGDAYNLGPRNEFDAPAIRRILSQGEVKLGISAKKADMYLRDMHELGVWHLRAFEEVNVASDMNTMRVALRTGIVKTRIPLLSSFMDVYCYQYSAIDQTTQDAWRKVWECWKELPNSHAVESPAVLDYLIYRMGKHCCTRSKRHCDSVRQLIARLDGPDTYPLNRMLADDCTGYCIFTGICDDDNTNSSRKKLNPPKSISIYGRYGWTVSDSDEGGGLGLRS